MNKIKKAIDTIRSMASNKKQNVNKFILSSMVLVLEREINDIKNNNDLMCDVIKNVEILSNGIQLHEAGNMRNLFDSFDALKKSCDKENTTCHCGKKLRGIERA